jgi:hypothetical protein
MSAESDAMLAAIKAADERKAERERQPLPDQGVLFPGMRQGRAEFYIEQIRAMVYGPSRGCPALYWWNEQMSKRDRRFVCRLARADVALSEKSWLDLTPVERAQVLAAFVHVSEWVESFHAPLYRFKELAFEPSP